MGTYAIVTGAAGRMGSAICSLIKTDDDMELIGAVERAEYLEKIKKVAPNVSSDLKEITAKYNDAVIIDFTYPEVTQQNVEVAVSSGNPMVIGTTGLNDEQMKLLEDAAKKIPIFWAPNMSVGINVLLNLLPKFVELLGDLYDVEISEIHHKFKKDAPSGTAVKLAQVLKEAKGFKKEAIRYCREGIIGERPKEEIGVQTLRGGDVVGDHTIYFFGPGERIEITHRAHSRETFAQGAIRAAKWIVTKEPGRLYTMKDLFEDV
ncbi:4-hydroxy-tetrahydrodipicolinate reductase [Desulfothermus okinawensis JCM 13304]